MYAERDKGKLVGATDEKIRLWARIANADIDDMRLLKLRDAAKIRTWLATLDPPIKRLPVTDDAIADLVEPEAEPEPLGDHSTVPLLMPIMDGNTVISALPLREPDVGLGVIVEKLKGQYMIEASVLATLSGLTIPVVQQLKLRDLVAVRTRLDPFLAAIA
jgi:hypothetical protein